MLDDADQAQSLSKIKVLLYALGTFTFLLMMLSGIFISGADDMTGYQWASTGFLHAFEHGFEQVMAQSRPYMAWQYSYLALPYFFEAPIYYYALKVGLSTAVVLSMAFALSDVFFGGGRVFFVLVAGYLLTWQNFSYHFLSRYSVYFHIGFVALFLGLCLAKRLAERLAERRRFWGYYALYSLLVLLSFPLAEAVLVYVPLFLLGAAMAVSPRRFREYSRIAALLVLPFFVVLGSGVVLRLVAPPTYDGTSLRLHSDFFATLWAYVVSATPGFYLHRYNITGLGKEVMADAIRSAPLLILYVVVGLSALLFEVTRVGSRPVVRDHWRFALLLATCAYLWVAPNLLFALSGKYQDWVVNKGSLSYVGTAYAQFAVAAMVVAIVMKIHTHVSRRIVALALSTVVVAPIAVAHALSNNFAHELLNATSQSYTSFRRSYPIGDASIVAHLGQDKTRLLCMEEMNGLPKHMYVGPAFSFYVSERFWRAFWHRRGMGDITVQFRRCGDVAPGSVIQRYLQDPFPPRTGGIVFTLAADGRTYMFLDYDVVAELEIEAFDKSTAVFAGPVVRQWLPLDGLSFEDMATVRVDKDVLYKPRRPPVTTLSKAAAVGP